MLGEIIGHGLVHRVEQRLGLLVEVARRDLHIGNGFLLTIAVQRTDRPLHRIMRGDRLDFPGFR